MSPELENAISILEKIKEYYGDYILGPPTAVSGHIQGIIRQIQTVYDNSMLFRTNPGWFKTNPGCFKTDPGCFKTYPGSF